MTELSTAPTTGPGNTSPDGTAPPQDAGLTPAAPATASASTVLAQLEVCGWKSLHSLATTDKTSIVIDHVAIGPGGIFVIDAHSWTPAMSTAVGLDQQTVINASDALASQVRMLLPPLTRQYVVPLLTYVDASPMSMVRGALHICTTSMLQGVITSRRPVLNDAEIDDVLASLSKVLRSSPGAASATSSPSAAPTRRGFLRKNSRDTASSEQPANAALDPAPSAGSPVQREVAPPVVTSEPPLVAPPVSEPVAPLTQLASADGIDDPFAEPSPPSVADFLAEEANADLVSAPEPEPAPERAPAIEPAADDRAHLATELSVASTALVEPEIEDLAHPAIPTDTRWDLETEPDLAPELDPPPAPVEAEIEDLAHPAIPTDTRWDLETELDLTPELDLAPELDPPPAPVEAEIEDLAHPPIPTDTRWDLETAPDLESQPVGAPMPFELPTADADEIVAQGGDVSDTVTAVEPIVAAPAPALEPAPQVESVQPTLAAAALTPAVTPPPTAPAAPRQPGGRRKASAPKAGLSRLIPSRPQRSSGRSSRKTASSDGDASQEPDLGELTESIELAELQRDSAWDALEADEGFGEYQFDDFEPATSAQVVEQPRQQIRTTDVIARSALPQEDARPKKSRLRRKKKDRAEFEDDDIDLSEMPANLSERGRAMYMELQRRPKPEPVRINPAQTGAGKAGAVRKLFVFCVIGGAIGITSSNYEQINTWVSTHVEHLPGLQKIEGPPQPEKPIKAKGKNVKNKPVKGARAGNAQQ